MAQMNWKQFGDCADQQQPLPSTVRRVDCAGLAYGFPVRFLESNPNIEINALTSDPSQVTLNVSATSRLDKSKLLINIAIWSAVSAVLIGVAYYWFTHRDEQNGTNHKPDTK